MLRQSLPLTSLLLIAALLVCGQPGRTVPGAACSTRPNLTPLRRALAPLSRTGPLSIHTSVSLEYNLRKCDRVTHDEDLQIISLRPGCFRAVVTSRTPQGVRLKPYLVFSNNGKVWVYYRPDLKQYYVESGHGKLDSADWGLGIVNVLRSLSLKGHTGVLSYPTLAQADISEHAEGASSGRELVYRLDENSEEFRFYVRASSNTLDRVEWHVARFESSFHVSEENVRISPSAPVPKSTFQFIPPPGSVNKPFPLP